MGQNDFPQVDDFVYFMPFINSSCHINTIACGLLELKGSTFLLTRFYIQVVYVQYVISWLPEFLLSLLVKLITNTPSMT